MPGLDHTSKGVCKAHPKGLGRSPSRFATLALFKPQKKHDTFAYTAFASASNLCLRTYIQLFTLGNLVWGSIRPGKTTLALDCMALCVPVCRIMANRSRHCEPVHNRLTMAASVCDNPEVGTVYSTDYGGDDWIPYLQCR